MVTVPITPTIRAILWPLRGHDALHVFTYVAQRTRAGRLKDRRYPLTYSGVKITWRRLRKQAGVTGFRFHDFRHDLASKLLRDTGNLKLVQRALNHASIKTTVRYAHVLDDEVASALERVGETPEKSPEHHPGEPANIRKKMNSTAKETVWRTGGPEFKSRRSDHQIRHLAWSSAVPAARRDLRHTSLAPLSSATCPMCSARSLPRHSRREMDCAATKRGTRKLGYLEAEHPLAIDTTVDQLIFSITQFVNPRGLFIAAATRAAYAQRPSHRAHSAGHRCMTRKATNPIVRRSLSNIGGRGRCWAYSMARPKNQSWWHYRRRARARAARSVKSPGNH